LRYSAEAEDPYPLSFPQEFQSNLPQAAVWHNNGIGPKVALTEFEQRVWLELFKIEAAKNGLGNKATAGALIAATNYHFEFIRQNLPAITP
jgi:hypothetical protein